MALSKSATAIVIVRISSQFIVKTRRTPQSMSVPKRHLPGSISHE